MENYRRFLKFISFRNSNFVFFFKKKGISPYFQFKRVCSFTFTGRSTLRKFGVSRWFFKKFIVVSGIQTSRIVLLFNYKFSIRTSRAYLEGANSFPNLVKGKLEIPAVAREFVNLGEGFSKRPLFSRASKNGRLRGFTLKSRIDVFLRLLIPGCVFYILKKRVNTFFFFFSSVVLWPKEYLDILGLILYSNTVFINTSLFDLSGSINLKKKVYGFFLYYVFKVPTFST